MLYSTADGCDAEEKETSGILDPLSVSALAGKDNSAQTIEEIIEHHGKFAPQGRSVGVFGILFVQGGRCGSAGGIFYEEVIAEAAG